jgi:CHAD domain-containing protein
MKYTSSQIEKCQADVEERFNKINLVLQKIIIGFATDDIHDFRVEIKKLKALLRLFSSVAMDPSAYRFPKSMNKVYKAMGHLREWQIQHQKISKSCSERNYIEPVSYLNKIGRKTDLCKLKAGELIRYLPSLEKKKEQIKNHCPEKLPPAAIQSFILTKTQTVHHLLLAGANDDASMHNMRKLLKDVQYTLSDQAKELRTAEGSSRLKAIQKVSGLLGDFHDLCVAVSLINRERKVLHKTSEEKKLLRDIRKRWQIDKENLRQEAFDQCMKLNQLQSG